MSRVWEHHEVCRIAGLRGDPAAIGAAVTVALCGHWEHEGACRWEHFTESAPEGESQGVTVSFDAPAQDEATVRELVRSALRSGSLTGPDGQTTTWRLVTG